MRTTQPSDTHPRGTQSITIRILTPIVGAEVGAGAELGVAITRNTPLDRIMSIATAHLDTDLVVVSTHRIIVRNAYAGSPFD